MTRLTKRERLVNLGNGNFIDHARFYLIFICEDVLICERKQFADCIEKLTSMSVKLCISKLTSMSVKLTKSSAVSRSQYFPDASAMASRMASRKAPKSFSNGIKNGVLNGI